MLPGQYVKRGDGSRWQIVRMLQGARTHRLGATVKPVQVTMFHLVNPDNRSEVAYVHQWGASETKAIGYAPEETLTLAEDQS